MSYNLYDATQGNQAQPQQWNVYGIGREGTVLQKNTLKEDCAAIWVEITLSRVSKMKRIKKDKKRRNVAEAEKEFCVSLLIYPNKIQKVFS